MDPQLHYFSYVRVGNARKITEQDDPARTDQPARAVIGVTTRVTTDPEARAKAIKVQLFGPGEVTALDERQVIRTDPPRYATDFPPNLFPLVEFYWPVLPWLFTPTKHVGGRLRPWLCLVVVRQDRSALRRSTGDLPRVLTVDAPADELPDLAESWAWAYAQVTGDLPADGVGKLLAKTSERTLARLVCPRRLEPGVAYRACVVPVFEAGRKVGLGLPLAPDDMSLAPAWAANTPGPLELPAFYAWEFSTGPAGDFEALAYELRRRRVPGASGSRPLRVGQPAPDWPAGEETRIGSALRPADAPPLADGTSAEFRAGLLKLLNAHEDWEGAVDLPPGMPMPPPIYGRWHAQQPKILEGDATAGQPGNAIWLRRLNLEAGYRAVAGLGARVVREQQEALMEAAWEQLGEIERVNQALRQAQLAMEVGRRIYARHLRTLAATDPTVLLALTGPVHGRVYSSAAQRTVRGTLAGRCLPVAAVEGAFRRLTRPRGPLGRRLGGAGHATGRLIRALNSPAPPSAPPLPQPAGMIAPANLDLPSLCELTPRAVAAAHAPAETRGDYAGRREAFLAVASRLHEVLGAFCEPPGPTCEPLDVGLACETLLVGLRPEETVPARIGDRLTLPAGRTLDASLDPILAYPVFPQPMYRSLAELSQDFLLAGVEHIPPDTILLLESNARFIEAFMAGLNDEIGRELLWRGFPTDQRGTPFRRFWEHAGAAAEPWDITAMHEWGPEGDLGSHRPVATQPSQAVLLIRGRLLERFPNAPIYVAKAAWSRDEAGKPVAPRRALRPGQDPAAIGVAPGDPPADQKQPERAPVFEGALAPDLTFLGFDLSADDLRGNQDPAQNKPGWFIVLQQPPAQPRYGLDATRAPDPKGTWEDLSWDDVRVSPSGHIALSKGLDPAFNRPDATTEPITWDAATLTSARLASITLQAPVRVAIHASDLLRSL